jgi:tetratricopeptide (TPR) repeat protein
MGQAPGGGHEGERFSKADARRLLGPQPELALGAGKALLASTPRDPELRLLIGSAHRRLGDVASACAVLRPLAVEQPKAWGVHFELGASLACGGDTADALISLQRAAALNSGSPLVHHALADQRGDVGGLVEASASPPLRDIVGRMVDGGKDGEARLADRSGMHLSDVLAANLVADVALAMGRADWVVALLEPRLAQFPKFQALQMRYAKAALRAEEPQRALAVTEGLAVAQPQALEPAALRAAALTRLGDFETAASAYRKILDRFPDQPPLWLSLGHVSKILGQPSQALEAYRRAIALRPDFGEAYWSIANLKVIRFESREREAMQALIQAATLGDSDRIPMLFALGKAFEDGGEDAAAFACYQEANQMRRASALYDAAANTAYVDRALSLFTPSFFAERKDAGDPSDAPIFIVGLPRSGSTLVEQVLASHSKVEGLSELPDLGLVVTRAARATGRLEDYPSSIARLPLNTLSGLGRDYLARVQSYRKTGRTHFVDKFPGNVFHAGLIHLILPNAKIIDVRRSPMGACVSLYKQLFAEGQHYSYDLHDLGRYYNDYRRLLCGLNEALPERIHRIVYEDLVADPEGEVRRLLTYCGLDYEETCLRFHDNPRPVRTASAQQVRRPISGDAIDQWRRFEPWLGPLKAALEISV